MIRMTHAAAALAVLALPMAVLAAPVTYTLPDETATFLPGPGVEVAEANCMTCHSIDYINYQPPKKGDKFWTAVVTKMIKVYAAPISEEDAQTIAAYLAATY